MIYHIYWGTAGNSGLYLDEIYQSLKKAGFKQRAFVNYYYPFDYGDKVFFRYGDVGHSRVRGVIRKAIQLFEILCGYFRILFCSIKDKPLVINYSHVGQSYSFIYLFLRMLKQISHAELVITCHDVLPFCSGRFEMKNRNKIFHQADYLLVHTEQSTKELKEYFGIDEAVIIRHPFPIMDLSKIDNRKKETTPSKDTDFLFIGHLRKAKGIVLLLEAWKDFHGLCPEAKLMVCGQKLSGTEIDEGEFEQMNVEFHLHFIDDDDYARYIRKTRYVVLPYLQGTNSGIISTVLSLDTEVITSDLPMFSENRLVPKDNMFRTGEKDSLITLLYKKYGDTTTHGAYALQVYRELFDQEVISVYEKLSSNNKRVSQ